MNKKHSLWSPFYILFFINCKIRNFIYFGLKPTLQATFDPAAAAAAAEIKRAVAWDASAGIRAAAAAAAADASGRITVPVSCLSTRPPSRQQQQSAKQEQARSRLAARATARDTRQLVSRGGTSMFLTGEEEEEWAGDTMVLGDEDAREEVLDEAALAAAVRAAVAEAKYQSLLDAEERRLELLKVAARPFH